MDKNYELTCLISPDLQEAEVGEFFKNIEIKGEITKKIEPRRIRLSYPILKKKEAFLATIEFKTEDLGTLQQDLKKQPNILRFLLISKQEEKQKPAPRREAPKQEKVEIDKIGEKLDQVI